MLKRSLIASAAIAVVQLDAATREAAMKIPMKEALREIGKKLQAELDAELLVAIERHTGEPLVDPEVLRGRFVRGGVINQPGETYYLDGVAILWAGPVAITRHGDDMGGSRVLRHLVAGPLDTPAEPDVTIRPSS